MNNVQEIHSQTIQKFMNNTFYVDLQNIEIVPWGEAP